MKKLIAILVLAVVMIAGVYAGGSKDKSSDVSGIVSMDEALAAVTTTIGSQIAKGTEIVIAKIDAPISGVSDFLSEELTAYLTSDNTFIVLERGPALEALNDEQEFQMSGKVTDESAVGIGHYLGAKVVITGILSRYADFSQLSFRFIDVKTARVLATYRARIRPDDTILANIMGPTSGTFPNAVKVSDKDLGYLNKGKEFYAQGKWDKAIAEFNKTITTNNNVAEVYFYRGEAYFGKGDIDKAMADYAHALQIDPDYWMAYFQRGEVYLALNDVDRAIPDFTQVLRIDPNNILAYIQRGYANINRNYIQAREDLSQAIRLDPNKAGAAVYFYRGSAYLGSGIESNTHAIEDFTQVIRLDPNYTSEKRKIKDHLGGAYSSRGNEYLKQNDYDRAIADYSQAISLNPDRVGVYYRSRGDAYLGKKDYDKAIADYSQAISLKADTPSVYLNRGIAYHSKGDYERAIADYEQALRGSPLPKDKATAQANLEAARKALGR